IAARLSATRNGFPKIGRWNRNSRFRRGSAKWHAIVRRLKRGQRPEDAAVMFEAADEDVYGLNLVINPALSDASEDAGLIDIFVAAHEIGVAS
ncbi:S9 family peptidase, partial [Rhizobium ruizarguesonis]